MDIALCFDNFKTRFIQCDRRSIRVNRNLAEFFQTANKLLKTGHDWWWIDALCIDQSKLDERSTHVGLMGEIYSRSQNVGIWLGASMEGAENFRWIHEIFFERAPLQTLSRFHAV